MTTTNIDIQLAQVDQLPMEELTTTAIGGTGVFDVLMAAVNAHIQGEFTANRIRGPEYSQVYLGALQAVLGTSVDYLLKAKTLGIEISNLEQQGELIAAQIRQINANIDLRLPAEIASIEAQTALTTEQTGQVSAETILTNKRVDQVTAELAKIPVEVQLLEKQVLNATTQNDLLQSQVEGSDLQNSKVPKEIILLDKQALQADAQTAFTTAQKDQVLYETANRLPVEVANLTKQGDNLVVQKSLTEAQTAQTTQQTGRIPYEIEEIQARIANMSKQNLLLEKDYDLRIGQLALQEKQIALSEAELLVKQQEIQVQLAAIEAQQAQADLYRQKVTTEQAQTQDGVAGTNSVLGANISVLKAQADGYTSDKLQKLTKILVDTWNVRRNSDDATQANVTNQLHDANLGVVIKGLIQDAGLVPNTTG